MLLLILIIVLLLQNVAPQSIRRSAARRSQTLEEIQTQLDDVAKVDDVKDGTFCHVSSENLLLAAEATARGVLQGVCNPREIEDRLHNIESQIADQFTIVKTMILNIEQKMASQENNMKRYLRKLYGSMENLQTSCRSGGRYLAKQGLKNNRGRGAQDVPGISTPGKSRTAQTGTGVSSSGGGGATLPSSQRASINGRSQSSDSQLPSQDFDIDEDDFEDDESEGAPGPRQFEIDKFNNTIHVENGKRVYTFYWQVDDMKYKIENWGIQRSLRSNSFYIFQYGYRMYMRIYPRQNGKNLFIHVGLTKGEYDEALEWPFTLKHRITIMDQSNSPVDTMSRIWDPQVLCSEWNWKRPQNYPNDDNYECVGLGLPHSDVTSRDYIQDNSLLIKFTVFLDPIFS